MAGVNYEQFKGFVSISSRGLEIDTFLTALAYADTLCGIPENPFRSSLSLVSATPASLTISVRRTRQSVSRKVGQLS